ncbi:DUF1523 family protein [Robiginitomaculum antarcticum]|uniref:DUF1523 family protein n=1 Tax=Robiginitomaculum antarcticum TaxID=437507 RepID=UPI000373D3AF|nr:DUF1523 family protein [Robiginitomaculum antarcticum]
MKFIKRFILFTVLLITAIGLHYYMPQRDIVKIVDTDVKRMDIRKGSPFWDSPDVGTNAEATRDVRFISTVRANGKSRVYRNEDTGWAFPFYLKFDSSELSAKAADMSAKDGQWVAVTHYGWRIRLFSIWPNATKIKPVDGPNVFLIPWFNIAFLTILAVIIFIIWRAVRKWTKTNVDPVTDRIDAEIDDMSDTVSRHAGKVKREAQERHSAYRRFMRRWFGSS